MKKLTLTVLVLCLSCVISVGAVIGLGRLGFIQRQPADDYPDWWNDDSWISEDFDATAMTQEELLSNLGGFVRGVCHPTRQYDEIREANIEWVRFDINELPFDKNGKLTPGYLGFKEKARCFAERGFKVLAITPYPKDYIDAGYNPQETSSYNMIKKIARFYAEDLQGIVSAFQITNEMGVEHFTLPLSMQQAAKFIGIQAEAMYRYKGSVPVGYNLGGIAGYASLPKLMLPYGDYIDYVGCDFYLCCFDNIMKELSFGTGLLEAAHGLSEGKPILINEFGYIAYGSPKTAQEKLTILRKYGAIGNSYAEAEAYARNNMRTIIEDEDFPIDFADHLRLVCGLTDESTMSKAEIEDAYILMGSKTFDSELVSHFYCQLGEGFEMTDYKHTPQGQADFFTDMIAEALKLDYLCGATVYCYSDSEACYICGQPDCPVETGWGLVDGHGDPKPAYYAIQKAFGDIKKSGR